ncbi:hypothetical protein Val02_13040 [Virgisporangium aliadipatigenens]|uniref:CBM6 domain-containing protein n=1 Tax=Virgisporangium aliadipatigenens TaxID=741659 RepID=A0A8J3YHP9_9ACTN|nr:family 43 glycosylhydrolase [Virgisporangium aliadipatigenens]GIJ44418.1 hypothetical protein Val02_13040 [Virgisporangium aliadipatigenens]
MSRRIALALFVVAAVLAPAVPAHAVTVAPALVIGGNFPDPDLLTVDGRWYAYATNTGGANVPVAVASSLRGAWTRSGDALPRLGAWARTGLTWAPDVSRRADGRYLMYYTARSTAIERQCIGAALADSPTGPFTPVGGAALVCNAAEAGDIDPASYVDTDGRRYLLYKSDGNAIGVPTVLYLQEVAADGVTFVGGRTELLRSGRADEAGVIEAPVLRRDGGRYVLFYSQGGYGGDGYAVGYATSGALRGPYTKAARPLISTASVNNTVRGPGGQDVVDGAVVFHGWVNNNTARSVYVADLGWDNGLPVVRGSRARYEAEAGVLVNCRVRSGAAGASNGQVAAYIDTAASYVEVSVHAPRAGTYTAYVGYAAGAGAAQHTLTVNGGAARVVDYPARGWDVWSQVAVDVTLNAGRNTLRLTHRTAFAEIDYVEIA